MRIILSAAAILAITANPIAAQEAQAFNCQVERFYSTAIVDDEVVGRSLELEGVAPPTDWQFELSVGDRQIVFEWTQSPLSLSGEAPIFPVGSNSFASFHISPGPCLFVEGNCATTVLYSRQTNGSIIMQLQPVATMTFVEDGETEPFPVVVEAICTATEPVQ